MPRRPSLDLAQALGHDAADKRIDILRRLGEAGSISEAARGAGVSYKAAWQALETLNNLAGTPLVAKAVGGSGGGGAALTDAGRQVLEAAALMDQARETVLARLGQAGTGPVDAVGLAGLGLRTSMRNHLPCTVLAVRRGAGVGRVQLGLGEGLAIESRVTLESVQLLALSPGMRVLALCKATAVSVAARIEAREGLNVLHGKVTRASGGRAGGEVSLRLASGQQIVGFATAGHGLRAGHAAMAAMDSSAVVIALAG